MVCAASSNAGAGSLAPTSASGGSGRTNRVTPAGKKTTKLNVQCLDAAQPFDYESKKSSSQTSSVKEAQMLASQQPPGGAEAMAGSIPEADEGSRLKIGIVGFGTFGQFLARRFVRQGHQVLATSRSPEYNR